MLRPPSDRLRDRIRAWIDDDRPSEALGDWPRRLGREKGLLLIHGNQAYLWYLAPDGRVFALDTDDFSRRLEPETDERARAAVEAAAQSRWPELGELIGNAASRSP